MRPPRLPDGRDGETALLVFVFTLSLGILAISLFTLK